ncbi:MAG TPA: winged helix DNA-binding domain-containing protein [Gaiellaceae bacterium]|nr:winged helix DNA-binding domain-containing protein [Gaiellaceae bacterium]
MSERVLTLRELNRALLARQLLLERRRLSPAAAIERIGPLHAQGVESTYVNLWSRIEGFRREQLTRALERGTVLRGNLLRNTLHLVSAREYPLYHAALAPLRLEWLARAWKQRFDEPSLRKAERALRKATDPPRPFAELVEAVGGDRWLAVAAGIRLGLVTVPPAGAWGFHGPSPYAVAGMPPADPTEGMRRLVHHYFEAFGPASIDDLCFWASLRKRDVASALAALDLRRFRDERGRELLDLPRAPLPRADLPAPAHFLLRWDNLYLGHASGERDRIVPPAFRRHVYTANTVMPATFLVDGFVAGTWRYERGRVKLDPWRRLTKAERMELADEAERLAAFMA